MDWVFVATAALYVSAITVAASNARDEGWERRKAAGVATFLAGAGFALFYDDASAAIEGGLPLPVSWIEPLGAVVMLVGIVVAYTGSGRTTPSE